MFDKLIRDPKRVESTLVEKDSKILTKTGCKIYVPDDYRTYNFVKMEGTVEILGIYAIVIEDKYFATDNKTIKLVINPDSINSMKVEETGETFIEFSFDPGSVVIESTMVIKDKVLLYFIDDHFYGKGKVPSFLTYESYCTLFIDTEQYSGQQIGSSLSVTGLIAATISRDKNDLSKNYREVIKTKNEQISNPPEIVGLKAITVTASNTLSKTLGAYGGGKGTIAALVNQSRSMDEIEELLRT